MSTDTSKKRGGNRRRGVTAAALTALVFGMVGLSFASVPLYRLFCQVTGYGGTPTIDAPAHALGPSDAVITVRFDANVNSKLPWAFRPVQREVQVRLGEEMLVHYEAENLSDDPITGTATFSVTPYKAASYFTKIDCFCFSKQSLAPDERVSMPVLFYVDPEIYEDPATRDVKKMTLSYTFYPADGPAVDDDTQGQRPPTVAEAKGKAADL